MQLINSNYAFTVTSQGICKSKHDFTIFKLLMFFKLESCTDVKLQTVMWLNIFAYKPKIKF